MLRRILLSLAVFAGVTLAVLLVGVVFGAFGLGSIAAFCTWSAPLWGLVAAIWYFVTHE